MNRPPIAAASWRSPCTPARRRCRRVWRACSVCSRSRWIFPTHSAADAAMNDWVSFDEFLKLVLQQAVAADAEMQLQQRLAWRHLGAPMRVEGIDLTEGMDHCADLGVTELKFTFWLEPRELAAPARCWRALRMLLGRPGAQRAQFRLAAAGGACAIEVAVTVGRRADGGWTVATNVTPEGSALPLADVPRALAG